jgi:ABC-type branched-subunit amino acid transport system substrate-binding protein/DNA-directed RNA polymerase subunit RPC12/RpoP
VRDYPNAERKSYLSVEIKFALFTLARNQPTCTINYSALAAFLEYTMVVLRCSKCDKEIEVSQPLENQTIVCPHCGQLLAKGSGVSSKDLEDNSGETLPPPGRKAAVDTQDLPFLKPPQTDDELGWMGRYRVKKLLGHGGMAMVFWAEDITLQRPVALKVMKPEQAGDLASQRFLREAQSMAKVRNDHIVTIFEVSQEGNYPFLAMELLQGAPLDAWLIKNRPSPSQVVHLGLQIARGLAAAHHAGLIHRDIKPSNIWVEEPGRRVKILDFGLARQAQENSQLTHTGAVVGTPAYMAPEQADGQRVDERCDLFSLGCVLYELATGQQAFTGTTAVAVLKAVAMTEPTPIDKINSQMSPAFNELVQQLMSKNPARRPASAAVVVSALEAIAAGQSPPSGMVSQIGGQPAGASRRRLRPIWLIAGLGGIAALLLLGFVFGPLGSLFQGQPARPTFRGVSNTEITLGMTAPFSGPNKELGREMEIGLKTYFEHINELGGIAGRKIRLVALDDGYEPGRAEANMKELFETHKVFAVIGNVGTPTAEKTLPYALDKHLIFFGAFTGAPLLRQDPPARFVFNFRASYEEETAAMVKYLLDIKKVKPDQIAVFAQNDGYGDAGFRGVARELRKHGRDKDQILRVGYARNKIDVDDAVEKVLKDANVRAVIMVPTYKPAARFIQKLKDAKRELLFANVSFVGSDPLAEELREAGPQYAEGVMVTQVVPHPQSQASAVLKYRELLGKFHPNEKPSFVSLEGYLDAMIFEKALRLAGNNLNTDTLVDALEKINKLDLGIGTTITYGPSDHQGSHKVWGTVLDKTGRYQALELD